MKPSRTASALHCMAMSCLASLSLAASAASLSDHSLPMNMKDRTVFSNAGMQSAHPDFRWRMAGLNELERGALHLAHPYLRRAARYADKPAQAMLAELLWTGRGVERNPAHAYAWMDLAAERGYLMFVAHREMYWKALSAQERSAAIEFGRTLYAEYGDEVAKPRLEFELKKARADITGSHLGAAHRVRVFQAPSFRHGGHFYVGMEMPNYYDDKYWRPAKYWAWQDRLYHELPLNWKLGEVDVGDPTQPADEDRKPQRSARGSDPV